VFIKEHRNWTAYRELPKNFEVDFHPKDEDDLMSYYERMDQVWTRSLKALQKAYEERYEYVISTHGTSTSPIGKTTSRSQVRKLMRSKEATPYIIRAKSNQHRTVFVAAIRPKK